MGSRTFAVVLVDLGTISTNEIRSGRIGSGFSVPTVTVVSLGAATASFSSPNTYPSTLHCRSEFTARSMENAASAAVKGDPSEKVTPLRTSKVHWFGDVWRHPVDRSGCR